VQARKKSQRRFHPARDRVADDQFDRRDFGSRPAAQAGICRSKKLDPKIYATGVLQQPRSPYELMAGTVIAAALVTGINSDLPGQTIGTVI
jgi:type IV secretory pathway VirB10-like protein